MRIAVITFVLAMMTISASQLSASDKRTASEALAVVEKLCRIPEGAHLSGWRVMPGDEVEARLNHSGAFWTVLGQYYPKLPPGEMSIIDVHMEVPVRGPAPTDCSAVSN